LSFINQIYCLNARFTRGAAAVRRNGCSDCRNKAIPPGNLRAPGGVAKGSRAPMLRAIAARKIEAFEGQQ
jgi:hypothetical protein